MACCSADGPASVPRPCGKVQRSDAVVQLWPRPFPFLRFPSLRESSARYGPQCRWQTIIDTGASMLSLPAQFFDVLLAWIPDVECSYDEATYITRYGTAVPCGASRRAVTAATGPRVPLRADRSQWPQLHLRAR